MLKNGIVMKYRSKLKKTVTFNRSKLRDVLHLSVLWKYFGHPSYRPLSVYLVSIEETIFE
jgi:hypothetical protein